MKKDECEISVLDEKENLENTEQVKQKIMVVLKNGDEFVYGGDKTMEQIHNTMVYGTPATLMWKDKNNQTHMFHSSNVAHIYTF